MKAVQRLTGGYEKAEQGSDTSQRRPVLVTD